MSIRRWRCVVLLLIVSSLGMLVYLAGSPVPPVPVRLQEITENQPMEEIQLTEEDIRIAAEKKALLQKQRTPRYPSRAHNLAPPSTKESNEAVDIIDEMYQMVEVTPHYSVTTPTVVPSFVPTTTTERVLLNRNVGLRPASLRRSSGNTKTRSKSQTQVTKAAKTDTKQIPKAQSQVRRRTTTMNPRILKQLQQIRSVGEQLFELQNLMQSDRIYHQFEKNKSRQSNLSPDEQIVDSRREAFVQEVQDGVGEFVLPVAPPDYDHGYPIEVQDASFIPSPERDQQQRNKKSFGANKDHQRSSHRTGLRTEKVVDDVKPVYRVNVTPRLNGVSHDHNVVNNVKPSSNLGVESRHIGSLLDHQNIVANKISPTMKPKNIDQPSTAPKYEKMPNGDLTVHNLPKQQHLNLTEDKIKDLSDSIPKKLKRTEEIAKAFVMLLSDDKTLNDTVATVKVAKFKKPTTIQTMNGLWQVHGVKEEIFLYTAYFDDRPALDRHKVRIIGIANAAVKHPHCLLWYDKQSKPDIAVAVQTKIGPRIQPMSSNRNRYEPYIFTCSLIRGKRAPTHISVITVKEPKPSTLLKVQLPVKPLPKDQIDVGLCMSVVYWHQDSVRVVEWLEANRIWGIGEVTVYGDELSKDTTNVFANYAREGFVDFRQMPNILDDESEFTILLNMSPAINDCMYRNMYRYKKVLCNDVDEMIVPRMSNNYTEMLDQILAAKGTDHPHPSFMFRNVYFFTDFGPHVEEPWFLHSQKYLKHIKPSEFGYSVKSITDPQACIALQNHLCWKRIRKYDNKHWTIDVPVKYGRNQHYKTCHFDSYLGQLGACARMMKEYYIDDTIKRFESELYDKAAQKLLELKLVDAA